MKTSSKPPSLSLQRRFRSWKPEGGPLDFGVRQESSGASQSSTQRLGCTSFWAVYHDPIRRKEVITHNQKGTIYIGASLGQKNYQCSQRLQCSSLVFLAMTSFLLWGSDILPKKELFFLGVMIYCPKRNYIRPSGYSLGLRTPTWGHQKLLDSL